MRPREHQRMLIAPKSQFDSSFNLDYLDLSPLLMLTKLQEFTVHGSLPAPSHIAVMRQMTSLRTLRLESEVSAGTIQALAAAGHSLYNLERLDFESAVLSVDDVTALRSFPALTALPSPCLDRALALDALRALRRCFVICR